MVEVSVACKDWNEIEHLVQTIEHAVYQAADTAKLNIQPDSEVSLLLTDDQQMRSLNQKWRDQDKPTNVLSFPAGDLEVGQSAGPILGDVILAYETVAKESHQQQKTLKNHLSHLVIHGFFHLFGYDHINDREAAVMEQLETETLAKLGIENPYEEHEVVP